MNTFAQSWLTELAEARIRAGWPVTSLNDDWWLIPMVVLFAYTLVVIGLTVAVVTMRSRGHRQVVRMKIRLAEELGKVERLEAARDELADRATELANREVTVAIEQVRRETTLSEIKTLRRAG